MKARMEDHVNRAHLRQRSHSLYLKQRAARLAKDRARLRKRVSELEGQLHTISSVLTARGCEDCYGLVKELLP